MSNQTLFDFSPACIFVLAEDGALVDVNQAALNRLGYTRDELIGRTCGIVFSQTGELARFVRLMKLSHDTGKPVANESIATSKAGKPIALLWNGRHFSGGITGAGSDTFIAVGIDVSQRKQAEDALREALERVEMAARGAEIEFWELEPGPPGAPLAKQMHAIVSGGTDWEDQDRAEWPTLVHPDDATELVEELDRHIRGESPLLLTEYRTRAPGGGWRWRRIRGKAIQRDGQGRAARLVGIQLDVTAIKQLEQQAEEERRRLVQTDRLVSLGAMLSGVAHEINNPNQLVMMGNSLMAKVWRDIQPILDHYSAEHGEFMAGGFASSELGHNVQTFLDRAREGSERIRYVVSELREFAHQPAPLVMERIDINDVVRSSVLLLRNMLGKSTQNLSVEYDEQASAVHGNFRRIEQVLINLLINACQALPDPSGSIAVRVRGNTDSRTVRVAVEDTGIGIPEDDLARITDPFFTTKREYGGSGLGLSVCMRIAQEHEGSLTFSSTPGRGTVAALELPAYDDTQASQLARHEAEGEM